ncbi:MAG: nitronate monooxygenase [Caulobacterales bacterium]|nr:nitronate monooxygenase [Caulobacterales bacterium]
MAFDFTFGGRLRVPLIQAPMLFVSTPELVIANCRHGVMGTFPTHTVKDSDQFAAWAEQIDRALEEADRPAPWGVNLVVHRSNHRFEQDLALCKKHKIPVVITSKGAPQRVFDEIHAYGGAVFHGVGSGRHAEKAAEAGADAIIAICAGAGGHCGTINPFGLVNEIRAATDTPVILSGSMMTGRDILTAQVMGAELAYMGTRFIATYEANNDEHYRKLLFQSKAHDIFFSVAMDGAPANFIKQSIIDSGGDIAEIMTRPPGEIIPGGDVAKEFPLIKSAGHGVGLVYEMQSAGAICDRLAVEYESAKAELSPLFADRGA